MASSHILANLEEWMVAPEQEELVRVEANLFVVEETYLVRIAEPIPVESSEILVQGEFLGHMEPILEKLERVLLEPVDRTETSQVRLERVLVLVELVDRIETSPGLLGRVLVEPVDHTEASQG